MKKYLPKTTTIALLLIGSFTLVKSQTCPLSFSPAVNYFCIAPPNGIISADFDGDGNKDIAYLYPSTLSVVSILLGSPTATFNFPTPFTAGNGANDLATADLNNDGKNDIVVANFIGNNISVLLGTGTGSFNTAVNYTTASGPRHLAFADFNNDSKLDLVVSATNVASVTVLFGNGAGIFTSTANFLVGSAPQGIAAADFNSDGNSDIITANQGSNDVSLLLGNGAGSFSTTLNFAILGNPRKVTVGDFNGDNKMDVATAHFANPQISVLLGTGTGSFSPFSAYVSGIGAVCYGITSADFNNDGNIDIATPNNALNTAAVLLGSGTGTFAAGSGFAVQTTPIGICHNDFNNDGKMDLAVTNSGTAQTISILLNTSALPFISVVPSASVLCAGKTATLTASGATSYSWSTGANTTSITINPITTSTISVIGSIGTCSNTGSQVITVNQPPPVPSINDNGSILTSSSVNGNQWYLNGTAISGASSQTYTYTQNGTYYVIVTDGNGCSSQSTGVVISLNPVGINNYAKSDMSLEIYPNPGDGLFEIYLIGEEKSEEILEIRNTIGQIIQSKTIQTNSGENKYFFNLRNEQNGLYFLSFTYNSKVITKKLAIVR